MAEDKKIEEKWAANIAFTGDEATVKKVIKLVESLEEEGKVGDFTWIDGPYDSLQLMLKRRAENLALSIEPPKALPPNNQESSQNDDGDDEE